MLYHLQNGSFLNALKIRFCQLLNLLAHLTANVFFVVLICQNEWVGPVEHLETCTIWYGSS